MRSRLVLPVTRIALACAVVLTVAATTHAEQPQGKILPSAFSYADSIGHIPTIGAALGDTAPDFELNGSTDRATRLSELGDSWVALIFVDRIRPLNRMRAVCDDLMHMGVRLVVVCHDKVTRVRSQAQRENLPFQVLADPEGQVASLYGLRARGHSEAQPGFVLLDRNRIVRRSLLKQDVAPDRMWQLAKDTLDGM